jgi:hypothetical protein
VIKYFVLADFPGVDEIADRAEHSGEKAYSITKTAGFYLTAAYAPVMELVNAARQICSMSLQMD